MTRTLKMLLVTLVAILSLGSIAEGAAPKKALRHRTRHSSRVLAGSTTPRKKTKKTNSAARRRTNAPAAASKSGPRSGTPAVKRPPSTKPR
jgi:hypothetical protein